MPSHMGVQTYATSRNSQAEMFVEFIIENYLEKTTSNGRFVSYEIEAQKHYSSDIASDVWDHFVSLARPETTSKVELWCQTTCYKGNNTGKPEPNKTYEVRETLVEAISFREYIINSSDIIRTIHFTLGPIQYTYDWFAPAKKKSFDLSIYINTPNVDIFDEIGKLFGSSNTIFNAKKKFVEEIGKKTPLDLAIKQAQSELDFWIKKGFSDQKSANQQYQLVQKERNLRKSDLNSSLMKAPNSGADIKRKCNELVHGKSNDDPFINKTVEKLLEKNPFIKAAKFYLENWESFDATIQKSALENETKDSFVKALWSADKPFRLIIRRLLLRVASEDAINYVQDVGVAGVTEHNLYSGDHKGVTGDAVAQYVNDINRHLSKEKLVTALTDKRSKALLREAVYFEARNGTELKPSFDYIEIALKDAGYEVLKPKDAGIKLIGYHSDLVGGASTVKAYTNLKIICDDNKVPLAILKGKFFRNQEFPRRCKEESYVGLTIKYEYRNSCFSERFKIPIIMFVDMQENYSPPDYALRRLMAFGWDVAFDLQDVIRLLKK